ncbi:hypothetical protein AVEN_90951-1 [Araneus ventricosus]|uniref:Uncharacterized protein n=1 Tax=Araneus ventricosus TaxID=182803 RepID=A0A4Y2GUT6_ARAVE|nr:hypothetical protein AVEN_90951-1 [Araneus ventricosus]
MKEQLQGLTDIIFLGDNISCVTIVYQPSHLFPDEDTQFSDCIHVVEVPYWSPHGLLFLRYNMCLRIVEVIYWSPHELLFLRYNMCLHIVEVLYWSPHELLFLRYNATERAFLSLVDHEHDQLT